MQSPKPLNPEQLKHPRDRRSKFQGDRIRPASSQGFMARRKAAGVSTTHANKPGSNVREVPLASPGKSGVDVTGRRAQSSSSLDYSPAFQRDLTPRQKATVIKPHRKD